MVVNSWQWYVWMQETQWGDKEMIKHQVWGCWSRLWLIVSSSLRLPQQRGGNKWSECHLQKKFNNSFVYGAGQTGLLWRARHRLYQEKKVHTHTQTSTHPKKVCAWDWHSSWVLTICPSGWQPALLARAAQCAQTHTPTKRHLSCFITASPQRSFLACSYAIVAAKIRIYQLIEEPGGVTWRLSHISAHIPKVKHRKNKWPCIHTLGCIQEDVMRNLQHAFCQSITVLNYPSQRQYNLLCHFTSD